MNKSFSQTHRRSRLVTDLGPDELLFLRMDGEEELCGPFEWRVEALSTDANIDLNRLLGTHATVEIDTGNGQRHFDGIVAEARRMGSQENGMRYNLVLRPWLHVASLRRNQRIFHNMSVVQILTELFQDYQALGAPHFRMDLVESYAELEYTVQYGESDAQFAARMMERFGIVWHWSHSAGQHCLVLTDDIVSHKTLPGSRRPYYGVANTHHGDEEHFREWLGGSRMTTGAVRLTEYNFKKPMAAQEVDHANTSAYEHGQIESFDWPGDYLERAAGKQVVTRRIDEESGQAERVVAKGNVSSLTVGETVELTGDDVPEATGQRFLCLKAQHELRAQAYGSTADESFDRDYDGTFVLMPVSVPLRPERRTARPLIHGPQTAMVVGEGEIDCDEYGRVLVRFHWDLHDQYSMRCRVSQNWAGKGWGGMVIPRIGMEVVVEFLEGDPNKPLVTGCVYNGRNDPPYDLPANKTKSTFRTNTHLDGKPYGFNELTFEDESGREEVFLRASRDLTVKVDQHATKRVDDNEVSSVGGHQLSEVELSRTDSIGMSYSISVGGGPGGALINGKDRQDPFGLRPAAHRLGQGSMGAVGNFSVMAEKNVTLDAGNAFSIDADGHAHERIGEGKTANISKSLRVSVGQNSKETVSGRKVIDAHEEIMLRCGKSVLKMTPDGTITLTGVKFDVKQSALTKIVSGRIELN